MHDIASGRRGSATFSGLDGCCVFVAVWPQPDGSLRVERRVQPDDPRAPVSRHVFAAASIESLLDGLGNDAQAKRVVDRLLSRERAAARRALA